ncbi:MAG TPA: Stp1/IreP family PP2C-type Ser/Thr phosphatase [Bacillota bacterium]|nr:Stp1/IreP family PP2C-type Ser/Thr phosphatase [Bacillota bacterium]
MKAAYKTHIGCVRALNEDTGAVVKLNNGYTLAIVADGMGGHQAGDLASLMAVDLIKIELSELPDGLTPEKAIDLLDQAILKANDAIYQYAKTHEDCMGMGTTIAISIITWDWLVTGHIGDSRIYRISSEGITQLTDDHSLVNELLKNGQISAEEAIKHPQRNVLIRALGTDKHVDAEFQALEWDVEDHLLICSDGLSNKLTSFEMLSIIHQSKSPEIAVDALINQAVQAGGEDNVTAIVISNGLPQAGQENGVSE